MRLSPPIPTRVLIFGKGGLSGAIADVWKGGSFEVTELDKEHWDVTNYDAVAYAVNTFDPHFVINCAGKSDRLPGITPEEIVAVNLTGALHVSRAAAAYRVPCLLVASTAGMRHPEEHPWYGAAKAGVISHVESAGKAGQPIWALSPNRMNTPMRQRDWPDEDIRTRLDPRRDVVGVIEDILDGCYEPGANVVVRMVGYGDRIDIFEAPRTVYPSRLVG